MVQIYDDFCVSLEAIQDYIIFQCEDCLSFYCQVSRHVTFGRPAATPGATMALVAISASLQCRDGRCLGCRPRSRTGRRSLPPIGSHLGFRTGGNALPSGSCRHACRHACAGFDFPPRPGAAVRRWSLRTSRPEHGGEWSGVEGVGVVLATWASSEPSQAQSLALQG